VKRRQPRVSASYAQIAVDSIVVAARYRDSYTVEWVDHAAIAAGLANPGAAERQWQLAQILELS